MVEYVPTHLLTDGGGPAYETAYLDPELGYGVFDLEGNPVINTNGSGSTDTDIDTGIDPDAGSGTKLVLIGEEYSINEDTTFADLIADYPDEFSEYEDESFGYGTIVCYGNYFICEGDIPEENAAEWYPNSYAAPSDLVTTFFNAYNVALNSGPGATNGDYFESAGALSIEN